MGLFDDINFNIPPTAVSSLDFRLLDTPCDHLVRNELSDFNIASLIELMPYSGNSAIFNNTVQYSNQIDPNAETIVKTKYPITRDGSLILSEALLGGIYTTEETVVPTDLAQTFQLQIPPKTNTVTAVQKVVDADTGDILFLDFVRYSLSQLFGIITFTNADDIGETIIFTYLPDKRKINPTQKDKAPNYEVIGVDAKGLGIIKVFGRAFNSTQSSLLFRYRTTESSCTKCLGLSVVNDLNFTNQGRIQLVYDFSKLIQDFFKRFTTSKGSSIFDITEGTETSLLIGISKGDGLLVETFIKNEVVNLVYAIRDKQKVQQNLQSTSSGERIAQINSVDVRAINATDFQVLIDVQSESGVIEQITSTVSQKFAI